MTNEKIDRKISTLRHWVSRLKDKIVYFQLKIDQAQIMINEYEKSIEKYLREKERNNVNQNTGQNSK